MPVHSRCEGAIAVITLERAPVNALSHPMRQDLWSALERADADEETQAIVITGAGRGFCGGGDLTEMRSPMQQAWPGIGNHLLPRIERCRKPVIAALHGFAVGGGFELALACHYRIAERDTRIALPEIRHGVLPPTGSQRLPRAIGATRSLQLMLSADTVRADSFADTPLFERLCAGDVVEAACAFAAALDPRDSPARRLLRHRELDREGTRSAVAAWRERLQADSRTTLAMTRCVDAVEHALHAADFDAGLAAAKRLHDALAASVAAGALEMPT